MLISSFVFSDELKIGENYRLSSTVWSLELVDPPGPGQQLTGNASRDSKFSVVGAGKGNKSGKYIIKFSRTYDYKAANGSKIKSTVELNQNYYIDKTSNAGLALSNDVAMSFGGFVSGPLVIPFKVRSSEIDAGNSSLGVFVGYSIDTRVPFTLKHIEISPFFSVAYTSISVSNNNELNEENGLTYAAGILIKNLSGIDFGLTYGEDRIGKSKNWKYEGKGWYSISLGYKVF